MALLASLANEPRSFAAIVALTGTARWAARGQRNALFWCGRTSDTDPTWSIELRGATQATARFAPDGGAAVIRDDMGRLVAIDLRAEKLLLALI